jgi:hypothetical protein
MSKLRDAEMEANINRELVQAQKYEATVHFVF